MVTLLIFAMGVVVGAVFLRALSHMAEATADVDEVVEPGLANSVVARSEVVRADESDAGEEQALSGDPASPGDQPHTGRLPQSEPAAASAEAPRRWQPPYISGSELFEWAKSVSRGMVRDVVRDGPDAETASELAEGLHPGLGRAMLPDTAARDRGRAVPCPAVGQGTLGVTAPEAIALADWLRANLTFTELEELQEDVTLCEEWLGNAASGSPCALQGEDHVCMAFDARPLSCRPTLAQTLAQQLRTDAAAPAAARSFGDVHVDDVTRGVIEGLKEGLERAGLDAKSYELHSALRRALSRPDAAEAWARGEDVFAKCRAVGPAR